MPLFTTWAFMAWCRVNFTFASRGIVQGCW